MKTKKINKSKYLDLSMIGKVRLIDKGGNTIKVLSEDEFKKQYYVRKPKKLKDTYLG